MQTSIKQFQKEIADILNNDPWFSNHGVVWLPEDTLNVEYEIKKNLGQTGMVAVVTTPSLDYQGEHKTVISKKNYEKHVQESVTFTLTSVSDPSEVHEVVLNTDPTTKMVDGEKIYFSKWIDGNPIELTYGSPFPNIFGTMKDNVPNGFIPPPTGTTRWFAFVDNAEYRTSNDPFFFATCWTIPDEQGRTMQVKKEIRQEKTAGPVTQVAPTVEVTHYTVSGGCLPEGVEVEATPNGTRQEIVGHTRYTVTLPMSGEDPTSVSVTMETGDIIGMPFDKKLDWIGVKENAWFDTGYVPKVNDRVMLRFATPYAQRIVLEAAFATTATIAGSTTAFNYYSNVMNGAQMQMRRGSVSQNSPASFCKSGRFLATGNSQRQLRDGVMFSGPGNVNETGTRPFGLGVFPVWNPTMPWENGTGYILPQPFMQYTTATNANPTYSNTTISLALLGPNGGDNDIDNDDLCHCFRGKFHYFGIWHHLDNDDNPQFFGYPVLKDGKICVYDRVSGEVIQNGYVDGSNPKAEPISAIEYEEDEDFNAIETDSSEAVFTEQVETANKGFDVQVSLQVVENPTVNRGKPDKDHVATALDVAHRAVYALAGFDTDGFNAFSPSTIRQSTVAGAGNKLLQVDARFTSTPVL